MADRDPAFRGNPNLKPANAVEFVSEADFKKNVAEILRCRGDINYFAEKYFTIITQGAGKTLIKLFDKQKDLLDCFQKNDRVVVLSSRQTSKCVAGDSKVRVRNKRTGHMKILKISEFHEMVSK